MSRNRLHQNKVEEFKEWLMEKGWEVVPTKGDYEVFRAVKYGETTLIVHFKADAQQHLTLHGESEKWFSKWMREKRHEQEEMHNAKR